MALFFFVLSRTLYAFSFGTSCTNSENTNEMKGEIGGKKKIFFFFFFFFSKKFVMSLLIGFCVCKARQAAGA